MIYLAANDTAANGARVQSTVTLLYDETEPFAQKPWRTVTSVDGCRMATSHHETCAEAKREAEKMQDAYLEVHANGPSPAELRAESAAIREQLAAGADVAGGSAIIGARVLAAAAHIR